MSVPDDIKSWCNYHKFDTESSGDKYTNIILPNDIDLNEIFEPVTSFKYFDGFSPNLNKDLHLGHLANLIIAKSIQKLGITENTIAILGDTLEGAVEKEDALIKYKEYLATFDYPVSDIYFASQQVLEKDITVSGEDEYAGTKIFDLGDEKIVGIKSNGSTSYFYQDVALAQHLDSPTLYITGLEQNNHFKALKKLFPNVTHKGLGLVLIKGKKMSSSDGNVHLAKDIIKQVETEFDNNSELAYNILAGQILKYSLETVKNINMDDIHNAKTSMGLYLSYTMARMFSAGIDKQNIAKFNDKKLNYLLFKSQFLIEPNHLFNGLCDLCKQINTLYATHHIKDNPENKAMFQTLTNDLILGCKKLGLFIVDKV